MARIRVVLPAPFGPRSPSIWPSPSESVIPSRARVEPPPLRASRTSRAVIGASFGPRRSPAGRPHALEIRPGVPPGRDLGDGRSNPSDERSRSAAGHPFCRGLGMVQKGPRLADSTRVARLLEGRLSRHDSPLSFCTAAGGSGDAAATRRWFMRNKHSLAALIVAACLIAPGAAHAAKAAKAAKTAPKATKAAATAAKPPAMAAARKPQLHDSPSWSLSLLGGYAQYSDKFFYPGDSLADAPVAGLRFARSFGEYWWLEGTGSAGKTHGLRRNGTDGVDVNVLNASINAVAQITPPNRFGSVYLSGGFGYNQYKADGFNDLHFGVLEGAVGW